MIRKTLAVGLFALALLPGVASAQAPKAAVDPEEQMDTSFRKFGYVTGQAFACYSKAEQVKLEKTALNVGNNILRLFGSDRAFFYAAAFGAGAAERVDQAKCPAIIKEATEMVDKLKGLSTR
jgi:hypothetical protein